MVLLCGPPSALDRIVHSLVRGRGTLDKNAELGDRDLGHYAGIPNRFDFVTMVMNFVREFASGWKLVNASFIKCGDRGFYLLRLNAGYPRFGGFHFDSADFGFNCGGLRLSWMIDLIR